MEHRQTRQSSFASNDWSLFLRVALWITCGVSVVLDNQAAYTATAQQQLQEQQQQQQQQQGQQQQQKLQPINTAYVVLGYNELGMHCMNQDFSQLCILPPFNSLHAQVIRRGREPQVVTSGVSVNYRISSNTTSVTKTNFWQFARAAIRREYAARCWPDGKHPARVHDANGR